MGDVNLYVPYNRKGLIIKFNNKYICFYSLFKIRVFETKENHLREAWKENG